MNHPFRACLGLGLLLFLPSCAKRGVVKTIAYTPPPAVIPEAPPSKEMPVVATLPEDYTVKSGDSLWRISRRLLGEGGRSRELARLNEVRVPDLIQPGQRLKLPSGSKFTVIPSQGRAARAAAKASEPVFVKVPNNAFGVGERLKFAVQYFGVTAGDAILSVKDYALQSGRPTLHVVAEARTHPFFERFFRVRDQVETFIDMEGLFPWRYEKHLQEGKYKADSFFLYDQRKHLIIDDRGQSKVIPAASQDVISCFYYFRTLKLEPGQEHWLKVTADDMKNYELQIKVLRREKVKVLAGQFDCLVVQPFMKFEGVFQQKGEVFVWISDDPRHLPVLIKSKILIGTIDIVLQDAQWVAPKP